MSGSVTQVSDNSGKEETEGIDRQAHGVESETVEPDLWVFERINDTAPGELFFSSSVSIFLESCDNILSLLGSEETGSRGVVIDEEVRGERDEDSQETLL